LTFLPDSTILGQKFRNKTLQKVKRDLKAEENRVIVKAKAEGKLIPARDEINDFLGFENRKETILNTHRMGVVVSHLSRFYHYNIILFVNCNEMEIMFRRDERSILSKRLFFCSFPDKIL
jgi:hypothetical protein